LFFVAGAVSAFVVCSFVVCSGFLNKTLNKYSEQTFVVCYFVVCSGFLNKTLNKYSEQTSVFVAICCLFRVSMNKQQIATKIVFLLFFARRPESCILTVCSLFFCCLFRVFEQNPEQIQ